MCGIAGYWEARRGAFDRAELLGRMGAALEHRGPDDAGVFHDEGDGVGLAFRRLSILDLSAEGHQPMFSASGRYVIVFNGEVYNFEEIRDELGPQKWRGHSDTEVILESFERWGVEGAVQRFVGMFAIALWDREKRRLHLVRDRLGIKPVYYGRAGGAFVFASELKAIARYPEFEGEIDRDALALYMRHNYVPSPHCIYKGVRKLQPGCVLWLDSAAGEPQIRRYWSAEEVALKGQQAPFDGIETEAVEELHQLLLKAVKLRMIADVPLGAFLSGGIDSSTVVALMQAQSTRPVKTFTIGFYEDGYNEAADAKRVAAHLGTEHTDLYLTSKDALDVVPLLARMYDEPFGDSSQVPTFLVSKLARRSVTVSLSGDGGDELFGGYNRYTLIRKIWNFTRPFPKAAREAIASLLHAVPPQPIDGAARLLEPLFPRKLRHVNWGEKAHKLSAFLYLGSPQALYYQALSHWADPTSVVIGASEPGTVRDCIDESSAKQGIENVMMLTDQLNYLPDDILTKVDRASMAVSLEARVPLLDHRVVEFAWRLPLRVKIRRGTTKWILRQILYKYVPARLIERPKMGFGIPIGRWLRSELRDWAEDLLSDRKLSEKGLFNSERIRTKWREHLSGARDWQYLLWDVLVFQEWHEGLRMARPAIASSLTRDGGFTRVVAH